MRGGGSRPPLLSLPGVPEGFQHCGQRLRHTACARVFSAPWKAQSEDFLHHQRSKGIGRTHYNEVNEERMPWKPNRSRVKVPFQVFQRALHVSKKTGIYKTLTINFRISMSILLS